MRDNRQTDKRKDKQQSDPIMYIHPYIHLVFFSKIFLRLEFQRPVIINFSRVGCL